MARPEEAQSHDMSSQQHEEESTPQQQPRSISTLRRALLITALNLAVFCQALDNTIISTAIPRITDDFNSLGDVGWYGAGYLLSCCALQLSFGKLYNRFPLKWVFLWSLGIFELGSLVCGATPTSVGLIMGRVIAGAGSGGIYSGAILAIAATVPLEQRSIYNGSLGAVYAIASIAGPLMGGAFTDRVTWRLCFYINLPIGVVTAVCVLFLLSADDGRKPEFDLPLREKLKDFDLVGLLLFIPFIVCLLIALQWGGSTYAWSNARIIALLVLSGVLLVAFIAVQLWQGDRATCPPSVVKQRTVWSCSVYMFFHFGSFIAISYYLPIWFQAIKGVSAVQSGIDLLPLILPTVVLALVSGVLVAIVGYYTWTCILASLMGTAGAVLLTRLTPSTRSPSWIGYQILYGAGTGFGVQQPLIAIQTALPEHQVSEGTAIMIFMQNFGGAITLAAAQSIFSNTLTRNVDAQNIPVDTGSLLLEGATRVSSLVPQQYLPQLRQAYSKSVTETFYIAVATAAASIIGSALIPWLSVKKQKNKEKSPQSRQPSSIEAGEDEHKEDEKSE